MSKAMTEHISHMIHSADILALQETRTPDDQLERLKIPGFQPIDYIGHYEHGGAIFVNHNLDLKNIKILEGNRHTVGIEIRKTKIFNVCR